MNCNHDTVANEMVTRCDDCGAIKNENGQRWTPVGVSRQDLRDAEYGMACLAAEVEELRAERDKAVTAFDRIALDPAEYRHALDHVEDCEKNCDQCRQIARDALERGVDGQDRAADLIIELAQLRAAMIAARRYRAAHLAIQGLPGELVPNHMLEEVWAARDAFDEALKALDGL